VQSTASSAGVMPHTLIVVDKILAGTMETSESREILQTFDRKGLSPVGYAALVAAKNTDDLLALKALLDPPKEGEKASLDQVVELLTQIAASQARQAETLAAVQARLVKMDNASFQMEQRVMAIEKALHVGLDGLTKGIRWLGSLLPDAARKSSSRQP